MKIGRGDMFWLVARIFVGFIFAYAGLAKLLEPAANFEAVLLKYGIFSPQWIPGLARIVPWIEWLVGCFLIVGYLPRWAAVSASLLALAFLVTLGSSELFLKSGGTDCGCFGKSGWLHLSLRQIFAVDGINFVLALRLSFFTSFPYSLHGFLVKGSGRQDDIKGK